MARIKREYYQTLLKKLSDNSLNPAARQEIREEADDQANDSEDLLRQTLAVNEKAGRGQTAQTADVKRDLAWMVSNHTYSGEKTVEKSRGRIDEAEKLLLESLALNEQTRGKDAGETLLAVLDAGDFYYNYVNFEKALAFYERFLQAAGQSGSPDVARALRPYANILYATYQEPEAAAALKRIEAITKKSEKMPESSINLHLRSKDAVAFAAPLIMATNKKAEDYRNALKAQGKPLTRANLENIPKTISIPVNVEIDESGKITKATAVTKSDKLKAEAENEVARWTVRPFSYNGTPRKLRGVLLYRKAE